MALYRRSVSAKVFFQNNIVSYSFYLSRPCCCNRVTPMKYFLASVSKMNGMPLFGSSKNGGLFVSKVLESSQLLRSWDSSIRLSYFPQNWFQWPCTFRGAFYVPPVKISISKERFQFILVTKERWIQQSSSVVNGGCTFYRHYGVSQVIKMSFGKTHNWSSLATQLQLETILEISPDNHRSTPELERRKWRRPDILSKYAIQLPTKWCPNIFGTCPAH